MKKILLIIAMLWGVTQAQTVGYLRYDTVKIFTNKVGGRGSLDVTGNVRFTGLLPKSAGTDSVVVRDVNGNLGTTAKGALFTTPTWQGTLNVAGGSTLTQSNDIDPDNSSWWLRFGRTTPFSAIEFTAASTQLYNNEHLTLQGTDSVMISTTLLHILDSSVGSSATNGYVWTLVDDNDGEGTWKAAAGGGISGLTTNELVYGNSATTIASLPVATYPSLTELSYAKGVTSAIQTQLNTKLSTITQGTTTITSGTDKRIAFNNAGVYGESANLTFDATGKVLGLGAPTINTWTNTSAAIQSGNNSIFFGQGTDFWLSGNARFNSGWFYKANGKSGNIGINEDMVMLRTATTGVADAALTWVVPIKADGTTGAIGGNISQTSGDYTGATLIANTTRVGIGGPVYIGDITTAPNASAALDVTSTTKGVLLPRMTATQGSAITGVNGLMIYVTDTNGTFTSVGFWGYEAGAWIKL